jgi:putative phosphoribosyl transferase
MVSHTKRTEHQIEIPCGRRRLSAILKTPSSAKGVVAFAHGSGSSRFSSRNQFVAQALEEAVLATLLLDLLEEEEADDREKVFNIELLADRLLSAANWLNQQPETRSLSLGYFGASTGAGAALVAAAREPTLVSAVVSRGGRPDLARSYLYAVQTPTLLIVGGHDAEVIELNEQALRLLHCPKQLIIVPGATHLFEEPGTLEEVARLAREWFVKYLAHVGDNPPCFEEMVAEIEHSGRQPIP